jgi:4-amino-4-deoxy-L-arabinose transferase-like glycosyltransferase
VLYFTRPTSSSTRPNIGGGRAILPSAILEATARAWLIRLATEVCGDAEWCVRAPSPLLYTATSIVLFLAARVLYGARIGFWSAVVFATLPAASFSSLLISTDVPLILFWTLAFYGWIRLIETRRCDSRR